MRLTKEEAKALLDKMLDEAITEGRKETEKEMNDGKMKKGKE